MTENVILSIIVPVYNVEKYIEKCICSILEQMTNEVELIIVDDCTPDKSIEICEKIIVKYPNYNIRIIRHEVNGKISKARNTGIEVAKGKYCWFVDSDDFITENAMKGILTKIKYSSADMFFFNHQDISKNYENKKLELEDGKIKINQVQERTRFICHIIRNEFGYEVWKKIFSIDMIRKNHIKFLEGVSYGEDLGFIIQCAFYSIKIETCSLCIYNYVYHPESMMRRSIQVSKTQEIYDLCRYLCNVIKTDRILKEDYLVYAGVFRMAINHSWNLDLYNELILIDEPNWGKEITKRVLINPFKLVRFYGKRLAIALYINALICMSSWHFNQNTYRFLRSLKEKICK